MLEMLGALDYDQIEEMNSLQINVTENIMKLKNLWKVTELDDLKRIIRYQLILELSKMEERKRVKRDER